MSDNPQPNPFADESKQGRSTAGGNANPYQPSQLPDLAVRRPGGLTAICIIAVVLGIIGLLSGVMKGVNVMFGAEMQQAFGSMGAMNGEQARVQQEMQAAAAAVSRRFAVANTILCVAQLVLCGGLVYSGLKTLGLKADGRKLLLILCWCMLVFEIGQMITMVLQQLSMGPIMEQYMPRMMKVPGNNVNAEKMGLIMARVSIIIGIVIQCGWTLIKLVFFAIAIRHFSKAKVIALFAPSPAPAAPKPETT